MNWEERYQQSHRPQPRSGSSFGLKLFIVLLALAPFVGGVIWTSRHEVNQATVDDFKKQVDGIAQFGEWLKRNQSTIQARTPEERLEQIQKELEQKSAFGGEFGATFKVVADYVADVKRLGLEYVAIMARLGRENPFDFSKVKSKAEIQHRRAVALELIKSNQQMVSLIDTSRDRFHEGFQKAGTIGAVADLVTAFADQTKEMASDRKCFVAEERIFQGLVDMCDLMEGDWGRWHAQNGAVRFDLPASAVKFNMIMEDVRGAEKELEDSKKERAALKK